MLPEGDGCSMVSSRVPRVKQAHRSAEPVLPPKICGLVYAKLTSSGGYEAEFTLPELNFMDCWTATCVLSEYLNCQHKGANLSVHARSRVDNIDELRCVVDCDSLNMEYDKFMTIVKNLSDNFMNNAYWDIQDSEEDE